MSDQHKEWVEKYDQLISICQDIVPLHERQLNILIHFIAHNNGKLPAKMRREFQVLSDDDIAEIEHAYREIFIEDASWPHT